MKPETRKLLEEMGLIKTAKEMALTSHNLSKDGETSRDSKNGIWKWMGGSDQCWVRQN